MSTSPINSANTQQASSESLSNVSDVSKDQKILEKPGQVGRESKEQLDETVDKFLAKLKGNTKDTELSPKKQLSEADAKSLAPTLEAETPASDLPADTAQPEFHNHGNLGQNTNHTNTKQNITDKSGVPDRASSVITTEVPSSKNKNVGIPANAQSSPKDAIVNDVELRRSGDSLSPQPQLNVQTRSVIDQKGERQMTEVSLDLDDDITVVQQSSVPTTDTLLRAQIDKAQSAAPAGSTSLVSPDAINNPEVELIKETIHAQLHLKSRENAKIDVELSNNELKINVQNLTDTGKAFDASALADLRTSLEQKYPHLHVQLSISKDASETMQNELNNSQQSKNDQQRRGDEGSKDQRHSPADVEDYLEDDEIS